MEKERGWSLCSVDDEGTASEERAFCTSVADKWDLWINLDLYGSAHVVIAEAGEEPREPVRFTQEDIKCLSDYGILKACLRELNGG